MDWEILPVFDGHRYDLWKQALPDEPVEEREPDWDAIREYERDNPVED